MYQLSLKRKSIITSMLPEKNDYLLDVGCGPINAAYFYTDKADKITCVDWKLIVIEPIPSNLECIQGDFTKLELLENSYDVVIVSDVFEHIQLENEPVFIEKCIAVLKTGGYLILSVPHKGTFAWLDPYEVKPAIHRLLWYIGLYKQLHNGSCDIRKGHKHYRVDELVQKFQPLQLMDVNYWGYFFDPLLSWNSALLKNPKYRLGQQWLEQACVKEFDKDYGENSFNVALKFVKPN